MKHTVVYFVNDLPKVRKAKGFGKSNDDITEYYIRYRKR